MSVPGHRAAAALVAAASFAIAACGSAGDPCAHASFGAAARFHGVVYMGSALPAGRRAAVGRRIGTGSAPCDRKTTVRALVGVPPAAAVAVVPEGETKTDQVYLAPGFLTALASHPLHAALFGVRKRWTSDVHHLCARPTKVRGMLDPRSSSPRLLVGRKIVLIDGHTRYHGPRRSGLPYLRGGERVTVRGRTCPDTRVMAQVIRAKPPA
jgi:hypothetical protein